MSEPTDRNPADYGALPADEQAAVRARWSEDIARRLEALDFAAEFPAAGVAYSELDEHGNVVHRHELDASISEAARAIRFGEVLAARGETTVALDEHGRLTRHYPDGTTSPLE